MSINTAYKIAFIFFGTIVALELIVYKFVKDKKIRFILLSLLGTLAFIAILIGTIFAKAKGLMIYISVLLTGYIISLLYIWKRIINKNE